MRVFSWRESGRRSECPIGRCCNYHHYYFHFYYSYYYPFYYCVVVCREGCGTYFKQASFSLVEQRALSLARLIQQVTSLSSSLFSFLLLLFLLLLLLLLFLLLLFVYVLHHHIIHCYHFNLHSTSRT